MTSYETRAREPVSAWAISGITFAGVLMIVVGFFQSIAGLAAILETGFPVVTQNYVFEGDVTAGNGTRISSWGS